MLYCDGQEWFDCGIIKSTSIVVKEQWNNLAFPAPTFRDGQKKEWYTCFTLDHQFEFFKKTFFFNRWGSSFNCSNNIHFHVFTSHPFLALTNTTTPTTAGMATNLVLSCTHTLFCFSFRFFSKTWSSARERKIKNYFLLSPPLPLALAVNKFPAGFIFYHARLTDFEEKVRGLWPG